MPASYRSMYDAMYSYFTYAWTPVLCSHQFCSTYSLRYASLHYRSNTFAACTRIYTLCVGHKLYTLYTISLFQEYSALTSDVIHLCIDGFSSSFNSSIVATRGA
jgi:hypothetical protein